MNPQVKSKPLDIIVWGATGFTGKLVAEYLAQHYGDQKLRWGIGGRHLEKLKAVRDGLGRFKAMAKAKQLPLFVAESHEESSLSQMVQATRVVCTTVGPYAKYGNLLVKLCAEAGIGYCDLTGEVPWMHETIKRYDALAKKTGARIVHSCGFDSIPSDLGTWMLQQAAQEKFGRPAQEITNLVTSMKGGFSGGTVASLIGILERTQAHPKILKILHDPYALDPPKGHRGLDNHDQTGVEFNEDLQQWTIPFLMAPINTRVVRRSNALLNDKYGKDFRYAETLAVGKGKSTWLKATALSKSMQAFMGLLSIKATRSLLQRFVLPKPGEGPSKQAREGGYFAMRLVGHGIAKNNSSFRLMGRVKGVSDPGYGETSKMLAESALCLALDTKQLPKRAGVLTPASAMGAVLLERLRKAGMVFEVEERKAP